MIDEAFLMGDDEFLIGLVLEAACGANLAKLALRDCMACVLLMDWCLVLSYWGGGTYTSESSSLFLRIDFLTAALIVGFDPKFRS